MIRPVDRAPKAGGPKAQAPFGGNMPRWLPIILFLAALTAAWWRAPQDVPAVFSETPTNTALPVEFFSEKIPETNGDIGPSSLARLPDGRLFIVWQENRSNDAADNRIRLLAQDRQGRWGQAKDVASRPETAGSNFAYVSQLGNPLLYAEGHWLHLWFVSHGSGDWRSAALQHRFSSDGGQHWSAPRKMTIAAAFNPGGLRLQPPLALSDGALALPLQENDGQINSWLQLAATGQPLAKTRLPDNVRLLATLSPDNNPNAPNATQSKHEQAPPQGDFFHGTVNLPVGAESVLQLGSQRLLAAGNPQGNRQQLVLWQSHDNGAHWQSSRIIEQADDGAAEFTHPFLLLAADGRIHLTYSWRRQAIKHLRFSAAWLEEAK